MLTVGASFGPILMQGPVVRGVTASEAKVFVRTDQAASVTLRYGSDPNLDTYLLSALATGSPGDLTKIISLSGLTPETSYYFTVLVNGVPQQTRPPYPSFTTLAPGESIASAETQAEL
jgi:alkaline phosphatase D